jgi:GxxExxY protein
MEQNAIGTMVLDAAVKIHRELGPGLLESVYEAVLARSLTLSGLDVRRQVPVPIRYLDLHFDEGFRADLVIQNQVVVELKSVDQVGKAHYKQLLTYLRLMGLNLGYILNFGAPLMKDGIVRVVNSGAPTSRVQGVGVSSPPLSE